MSDVWIEFEVVMATEAAILVEQRTTFAPWMPKSQVRKIVSEDCDDIHELKPGDNVKLLVPEWLVKKNGLDEFVCEDPT